MRVHITKSYNSAYKLLKGTKNDKTRKIPLPEPVIEQVSGDTQETILKRYSHMLKGDEGLVLEALRKIELKIV